MNTPICDQIADYAQRAPLRLHTPGHKGFVFTGPEEADLTEIPGADSLYEANGIILESENNLSRLYGTRHSYYSCEGSSLAIRAMVFLGAQKALREGRRPVFAAARNAHASFLSAAALMDIDVQWLYAPEYLSGRVTPEDLENALRRGADAVYLTSPDYLGGMADIAALSRVAHRHGALMLVDNAHGAYLKFLPSSLHPMDLGADICADSAHKTLPVLTGGAYLHVSRQVPEELNGKARQALALFGSTSPSYLILRSLDAVNPILEKDFPHRLKACLEVLEGTRNRLIRSGWRFYCHEPLKWTLDAPARGYTGLAVQDLLIKKGITPEYADLTHTVLLLSPLYTQRDYDRLARALEDIPQRTPLALELPPLPRGEGAVSIRSAMLGKSETVPTREALGRVLSQAHVACPPAVPILVSGERVTAQAVQCLLAYGVQTVSVLQDTANGV